MSFLQNTASPVRASADDPLGFDMKIGWDMDPSGRSATGLELVEDAMLHRLEQDRLLMTGAPEDEIEFGENVRAWVGEAVSDEALSAKAPRVETAIRRDVRIADCTATLTKTTGADASQYDFLIRVQATTISGQTIDRIVGVSAVTVEFLAAGR